jgi:hypothetical protein
MERSETKSNTKEVVEGKPVKEIAERAVSLETKASVKSAVDHLETHRFRGGTSNRFRGNVSGQNLQGPDDPRCERAWA